MNYTFNPIGVLALSVFLLFLPFHAWSQLSIVAHNINYTIDFDATVSGVNNDEFNGSGFQSTPTVGQLDSDAWAITGFSDGDLVFGGTQTTANTDYTRGRTNIIGVSWGGIYSFQDGSNWQKIGVQPTGDDFTSGDITLRIQNNTGGDIQKLSISYEVFINNDQDRSNSFNFSHSGDNVNYTVINEFDLTSPAPKDDDNDWISHSRSAIISGLSISDGAYYYLRWTGNDVGGSGSRDEFALDNIVIASTTNDATTLASGPGTQISSANISSLYDTPVESLDMFKIIFEEASTDTESTLVTNIKLFPHSTNTAKWTETIGGVRIYNSNTSSYITPSSTTITDDYMDIKITSGDIEIGDGSNGYIIVSVYLKTSGLTDNSVISFKVDADNHGFKADPSGTGFNNDFGIADFNSGDFPVTIIPTEVTFKTQPQSAIVNQVFHPIPIIALTDANGNIDLNSVGTTIRMTSTGSISNGGIEDANTNSDGLAIFNGIYETSTGTAIVHNAQDFNNVIGSGTNTNSHAFDVYTSSGLIISEIGNPVNDDAATFIELYNNGASPIDFGTETWYLSYELYGSLWIETQLDITKTIAAGDAYVMCFDQTEFNSTFGFNADQECTSMQLQGGDPVFLYRGANHLTGALVDIYGVVDKNAGYDDWQYSGSNAVRIRSVISPRNDFTFSEWVVTYGGADSESPGRHAQTLTWTGSTSKDFHDDTNWSPIGSPDASCSVVILATANTPNVFFGSCNDLTIQSGASIEADKFTVAATITNNAGTSGIKLENNISYTPTLITPCDNVDAYIGVFISNFSPYWTLISPPVDNEIADVFLGQYLDYWNEPTEKWVDIIDETTPLNMMQGYAVQKTPSLAQFYGKMRAGAISHSLDYSVGVPDVYTGWNLLGNPYPSNIDWDDVIIPVGMESGVSVWDGDAETYIAWNSQIADNAARYIQVGQGFFVRATTTGVALAFDDNVRTHYGFRPMLKSSNSSSIYPKNSMTINITGNNKRDVTYINFRDTASWDYDARMDVQKLFGKNYVPQIFSYINLDEDEKAAINSIPFPQLEDNISLGFRVNTPGNYQLEFNGIYSFDIRQPFFLLDRVTGQVYDLRADSIINFNYQNSDPENRFNLVFDFITEVIESEEMSITQSIWNIYSVKDYLFIQSEHSQDAIIQIYNIQGQLVYSSSTIHSFQSGVKLELPSAYYLVKLISGDRVQTGKVFIL